MYTEQTIEMSVKLQVDRILSLGILDWFASVDSLGVSQPGAPALCNNAAAFAPAACWCAWCL